MDVVTDISFVSAPFQTVNDRVLSASGQRDADTGYDSIEVHGGFLLSFESLSEQVLAALSAVARRFASRRCLLVPVPVPAAAAAAKAAVFLRLQRNTLVFTGLPWAGPSRSGGGVFLRV